MAHLRDRPLPVRLHQCCVYDSTRYEKVVLVISDLLSNSVIRS
jgi:hypothetical protein